MNDILDYWVFGKDKPPRPNQIKALKWLEEQHQNKKYLILELPVGGGKSAIAMTFSRYLSQGRGNAFILTPQKILQTQYENDFSKEYALASMYGKSNYTCRTKNTTCDIGSIIKKPKCETCSHEQAKSRAKKSPNVVFNYKLALLLFGYTNVFDTRSVTILDECHTAEEHLTEFNTISINEKRAEKFGIKWNSFTEIKYAYKWINETYLSAASKYLENQFESIEPLLDKSGDTLTASELKTLRDYQALESHVDDVAEFMSLPLDVIENAFVLVFDKTSFKFKHLTGAYNFKHILQPMSDKFLFMSSTILDYEGYCNDLGIDPSQAAFLSLDSEFPTENRPVYYAPQMKMNMSWKNDENKQKRDNMIESLCNVLELHKDQSGIIHTGNFQIAQWLVDQLEDSAPQQILHHNPDSGDDRNAIINQYITTPKPTLLISPSITEGLDLSEDLGRFAIFVKLGFPHLGDQWIRRRMEMSQAWYQRRALINIIQGGGRVVRTDKDTGYVYILDASWGYLYSQTKHIIPKWWRDAYHNL